MTEPVRTEIRGPSPVHGMFRYRTEIQDAGMPMPSYAHRYLPNTLTVPGN
jgi:hypothetical protein